MIYVMKLAQAFIIIISHYECHNSNCNNLVSVVLFILFSSFSVCFMRKFVSYNIINANNIVPANIIA